MTTAEHHRGETTGGEEEDDDGGETTQQTHDEINSAKIASPRGGQKNSAVRTYLVVQEEVRQVQHRLGRHVVEHLEGGRHRPGVHVEQVDVVDSAQKTTNAPYAHARAHAGGNPYIPYTAKRPGTAQHSTAHRKSPNGASRGREAGSGKRDEGRKRGTLNSVVRSFGACRL